MKDEKIKIKGCGKRIQEGKFKGYECGYCYQGMKPLCPECSKLKRRGMK